MNLEGVGPALARAILDMRSKTMARGATWEPAGTRRVAVNGRVETITLFASQFGGVAKRFDERFTEEEWGTILQAARRH